jgi:hypothetical protein
LRGKRRDGEENTQCRTYTVEGEDEFWVGKWIWLGRRGEVQMMETKKDMQELG